jgi:hypothetical protein
MESDSTQVTGSPAGLKAPRPGDVLCERFEIRDIVESDSLVLTYRGMDQETEAAVLVRVTAPGLLGEREAKRVHERLRPLIGARGVLGGEGDGGGASVWPGLLDVDREGALVSTVEPWPRGTSFRAVLEARRAKKKRFDAAELLPFIARIAAALDGLPDRGRLSSLHHGDLRASRVFVHPDGMSLTGGFLLSALPGDAVAEALTRDIALRRSLPPEFADGLAGRPADRHAVAALAWEALEGEPPPQSVQPADCRSEPALGAILVRYLDPDPSARPATLRNLVDALAARAAAPVPEHRDRLVLRGSDASSSEETTTETGSYQLSDGELVPLDDDTNRSPRQRGEDLDPDLVAAAKAASAISETGTFQLDGDELVPLSSNKVASNKAAGAPAARSSDPASAKPARGSDPAKPSRPSDPGAKTLQPQPLKPRAIARASEKPAAPRPVEHKAPENKPPENKPPENKPAESEPLENKPPENKPFESKPFESKPLENKRPGRPTQPMGELPAPTATAAASPKARTNAAPKAGRSADRTQELGDQDLVALSPAQSAVAAPSRAAKQAVAAALAGPSPAAPSAQSDARQPWQHQPLPPSGAPLPSLQTPSPAAPPAVAPPASSVAPEGGSNGLYLIVAAVVVACVILGAAFWYRAHEAQVRHEQEIEQRLRDLRQ